jgi:hypothetical protein
MMFFSNALSFALVFLAAFSAMTYANEDKVNLRTAVDYVILAKTGISTVPDSVITGDIAVSPITADAMTGFVMTMKGDDPNTYSTCPQVTGKAYGATYGGNTETVLTAAVLDMEAAYEDAFGRTGDVLDLKDGLIGGQTLTNGVYSFGTDVRIGSGTALTFDGDENAVFIIQMSGNLIQAANTNVILTGNAKAENIFWQVAGFVEVGEGAHMVGNLLVKTDVTFVTKSSLNGRVLTQTACNLQKTTLTCPDASDCDASV